MAKVSVHLVSWNSRKSLPGALESLNAQTFRDFSVIVVDNASADGSVECVRELVPTATVLRNFKNLGVCRAMNQAIELARPRKPEYVLAMSPDAVLSPEFLTRIMAAADRRRDAASFCGQVFRAVRRSDENDGPDLTSTIASLGTAVKKSRRVTAVSAGEKEVAEARGPIEVFGAPGYLALYRFEALGEAALSGDVFDEHFFASQEDIDLAWRLRLLGWKAMAVPEAKAHFFGGSGDYRSARFSRLAIRNHLLTLLKNDDVLNALLHWPIVAARELMVCLGTLFRSPSALLAYVEYWRLVIPMLRKRRRVMARRKVSAADIRKWFR
jgi:GT2 family glycosyltransferase